jgi:myo-inositol 2-dehydrogenase/D-chiro-inositol 1-dehydrogenase
MVKRLRLGLIGTGRIGRVHTQTLRQRVPNADLAVVTDVNLDSARQCAEQYGVPQVADHAEQIFADHSIDAVVICSSTDTHAAYIMQAARAGKHVFSEKPIDASLNRIDQALNAVNSAGVSLMVGFNRRFDSNHMRIKEVLDRGEVGTPHLLHIISRDPSPPPISYVKVSGGMFFDMTIHDFDMARFLLGEVDEIYAAAGVLVDPKIGAAGDVDTAMITLKFRNGALGVIDNSRQAVYGYDQRVEVFGSQGSARSENRYPDAVTVSTGTTVQRGLPLNFFMDRYLDSYQLELVTFVRSVIDGVPPPVSGLDGRMPVVMAMAARRSFEENRPVKLAEIEG